MQGLLRNEGRCSRYWQGLLSNQESLGDGVARAGLELMRVCGQSQPTPEPPENAHLLASWPKAARVPPFSSLTLSLMKSTVQVPACLP